MVKLEGTQAQEQAVKISSEKERKWSKKLGSKWALAPPDLVRLGLINDNNYQIYCSRFGQYKDDAKICWLNHLSKIYPWLPHKLLWVWGAGLPRGWDSLLYANQQKVDLLISEWSRKGCANANKFFRTNKKLVPAGVMNTIRREDIRTVCTIRDRFDERMIGIVDEETLLVHEQEEKDCILQALGVNWFGRYPARELFMVTAFPEHNVGIEWADGRPCSEAKLLQPIQQGLDQADCGLTARIGWIAEAPHRYFDHRTYWAFTIVAERRP
jgi:hypothetical protein